MRKTYISPVAEVVFLDPELLQTPLGEKSKSQSGAESKENEMNAWDGEDEEKRGSLIWDD